tara:strand:- start:13199 stop:13693 length:495 start_codon:yes stop_codon:yes gene_type:complete
MNVEIERRFLVKGRDWEEHIKSSLNFKQGYLVTDLTKWTIRVRIIEEKESWLTIKHPKKGIERHEFEYRIPISEGLLIWEMSDFKISKIRHELNFANKNWIIDCFQEKNFPLIISEIELNSINQKIEIPNWCTTEISHLNEFSNASLAKSPISTWPIAKRRSIL